MALRLDIPPRFLHELLQRATETVRSRILLLAPAETRDEIQRVIDDTAKAVGQAVVAQRDFGQAEQLVLALEKSGKLDERALLGFVHQGKYEEMTVALARLCSASLKMVCGLMVGLRNDALLVPCKAAGLQWTTAEAILRNRHSSHKISDQIIDMARNDYERLSVATAQRTLRFMQVREPPDTPQITPPAGGLSSGRGRGCRLTSGREPASSEGKSRSTGPEVLARIARFIADLLCFEHHLGAAAASARLSAHCRVRVVIRSWRHAFQVATGASR